MSTESQHQSTLFKWALSVRQQYPELKLLHHIPNGGKRDKIEAAHLKQQGVKPGVPDLHLPVARGQYHSLYIEMKNEDGKESQEQIWWREELNAQGNFATVAHSWDSAKKTIEWYLNLSEVSK